MDVALVAARLVVLARLLASCARIVVDAARLVADASASEKYFFQRRANRRFGASITLLAVVTIISLVVRIGCEVSLHRRCSQ